MRTELLKEDLRPTWSLTYLQEAHRAIYGAYGAQGNKRRGVRSTPDRGLPRLLCDYWLLTDSRRVALELSDATTLPSAARDVALDLALSALDWLLRVAEEAPAAFDATKGADGKVYVRMRDECKHCSGSASAVSWPAHHPQFCSQTCALAWIDECAEDVDRFDRIDDLIEEAKAEVQEEAQAEVEEILENSGKVDPNSDDNPLMRVIRLYGDDPTLTAEAAAWRLETSFRCGLRV